MIRKQFWIKLTGLILITAIAIGITGCAANSEFRSNGLPAKKYLVGGGLQIDWTAPTNGTAHLVEENTSRIIQSKYLEKGDVFEVSMDLTPNEFEEIFGIPMGQAQFSLYFIPSKISTK